MNGNALSSITLNNGGYDGNSRTTKKTADADSFLQLMITQLQSQTPLEPVDNDSMLQQMSNFSSMEQQQNLNTNLTTLLEFQSILARLDGLSQGSALIGRQIEFVNSSNKIESGKVESVRIDELGQAMLKVGKKEVPMSAVVGVRGGDDSAKDTGQNNKDTSKDSTKDTKTKSA